MFESYLDLIEKDTLSEVYDSNAQVVKVDSKIYKKVLDSNNNSCYQLHGTSNIYIKDNKIIPSDYIVNGQPILPTNLNCTNVTFNASGYLIMDKMEKVVDNYQSAPINFNVFVSENNKTFSKKVSGVNGRWLATDNSIQMTKGDRSDLSNPGNSTIINLTRIFGNDPAYTTTGVNYSANTNFKQWFYSTSGTRTNNMLDTIAASIYYNNINTFNYLVNPTNGKKYLIIKFGEHI